MIHGNSTRPALSGKPLGTYILALLLFGSNGVAASFICLGSSETVMLRAALGSLALCLACLVRPRPKSRAGRSDKLRVFLSGTAMAANWLLLFEAYARIGVGLSMLISCCGPLIVAMLGGLSCKERSAARQKWGLVLCAFGVVLICEQPDTDAADGIGVLCAVLSALAYAAMVMLNRSAKSLSGLSNSALQLTSAAVCAALFVVCIGGFPLDIAPADLPAILWLGLLNTGLGCLLYFSAIGRLPAQTVAVCGYLEPMSALVFAAVFLGESMGLVQAAGAALIVSGVLVSEQIPAKILRCRVPKSGMENAAAEASAARLAPINRTASRKRESSDRKWSHIGSRR